MPEPLARLREEGAEIAGSVAGVITQSELLFLCLPSAKHVRAVFEGDGILNNVRSGQVVVDLRMRAALSIPRGLPARVPQPGYGEPV